MVMFKSKRKKNNDIVKIKLSGKRIYPSASVKYLGADFVDQLTWQHHINDLSVKPNTLLYYSKSKNLLMIKY